MTMPNSDANDIYVVEVVMMTMMMNIMTDVEVMVTAVQ